MAVRTTVLQTQRNANLHNITYWQLRRIPHGPDLNHTLQLNQTAADGSSIQDQTTKVMVEGRTPAADRSSCWLKCQTALPIGRS